MMEEKQQNQQSNDFWMMRGEVQIAVASKCNQDCDVVRL